MVQINPSSNTSTIVINSLQSSSSVYSSTPTSSAMYWAMQSKEYADSILTDAGFIAVSQDLTNIDTVATNIADVNTVANNITDINTVAGISSDITTVAGISTDITAVNNNETNINTVAGNITNINAVVTDISNINSVAGDLTNIDSAVSNATNINACVSNTSNINTVAGMSSTITNVNNNLTSINTCSTNISNINTCANNIDSITTKLSTKGGSMWGSVSFQPDDHGDMTGITFDDIYIIDTTTAPSTDEYIINITGYGLGGAAMNAVTGYLRNYYATSGYIGTEISANRVVSNVNKAARFGVQLDTSGNDIAYGSAGVKVGIAGWSVPSATTVDIVAASSGIQKTAEYTGWVWARSGTAHTGNISLALWNDSANITSYAMANAGEQAYVCIPVARGQVFRLVYKNISGSGVAINQYKLSKCKGEL